MGGLALNLGGNQDSQGLSSQFLDIADPSTPSSVDSSSSSYLTPVDLSSVSNPAPQAASSVAGSDGSDITSSLGGLFAQMGASIATDYSAIAGPTTVKPGSVILNPKTGQAQYVGAVSSIPGATNPSTLLLLAAAGVLALVLVMGRK